MSNLDKFEKEILDKFEKGQLRSTKESKIEMFKFLNMQTRVHV